MRPEVQKAKEAMYRELVLEAAERIFATRGYEAAKVQEIAAEAGIAPGTFYNVFAGKFDVYRAVHQRRGQQLMVASISGLDMSAPTLEILLQGVSAYVRFHLDHPDYLRMHLREDTAWAVAPRMRSEEQQTMWVEGLTFAAGIFQRAIHAGLFVAESPEVMARTMIAMHQVRLADWVEAGMPPESEAMIHGMKQQIIRCFGRPERIVELLVEYAPDL